MRNNSRCITFSGLFWTATLPRAARGFTLYALETRLTPLNATALFPNVGFLELSV